MKPSIQYLICLIFILEELITEVSSVTCSSGIQCKQCCGSSCCYNDDHVTYEYRISFWNLWYFWFVILFVLMSCFGGCGYYKQRQRYNQSRNNIFGSSMRRGNLAQRTHGAVIVDAMQPPFYAYSGPGADIPAEVTLQPPAYSEVVSQPGYYPANKTDLPPYPGFDTVPVEPPDHPVSPTPVPTQPLATTNIAIPAPPAYTEQPTNQTSGYSAGQIDSTNQN